MNLKHILKATGSVALSAVMATASIPVTVYAEENTSKTNESSDKQTASSTKKTETVYAVLNGDGSLSDIVVSGWLHNDSGIKNLKEKLNLTDVKNVKTDEVPEDNNGEYTWNSDSNDIYYQGNSTEQLPVTMQITYELDGQQLSQAVLKKASTLDIKMICPLHAHIWRKDFEQILSRYHQWSTYEPQRYSVAIFYGSIYGNTQNAAEILAMKLAEEGMRSVMVFDTSKTDTSELVSRAFQYSTLVFASATYNAEVFDSMQNLLTELKNHNLSNRTIGLVENGSWAPMAANKMKAQIASMKNMKIVEPIVKIQSSVSEENLKQLEVLAKELAANTK